MAFGFSKANCERIAASVKKSEHGVVNPVDARRQKPIGVGGSQSRVFYVVRKGEEDYPYANQVYRAYPVDEERPDDEAPNEDWYFLHSMTSAEIPENSPVIGHKIRSSWHTDGVASGMRITIGTTTGIVPTSSFGYIEGNDGGHYSYTYLDEDGEEQEGTRPFYCAKGQMIPAGKICTFIGFDIPNQHPDTPDYILDAPANSGICKLTSTLNPGNSASATLIDFSDGENERTGATITLHSLGNNGPYAQSGQYVGWTFIGKYVMVESGCV